MALIRKERAGNDSHGNSWPEDGAVVEITDADQIASLMAIVDGGFSEVTPPAKKEAAKPDPEPEPDGDGEDDGEDDEQAEFSEVDPKSEGVEAPKPAAKKTAARKTAASKPQE